MIINIDKLYGNRRAIEMEKVTAELKQWLIENVGQYYGFDSSNWIHRYIGSGWEIVFNGNDVSYYVDIADEEKAMIFALRWL